MTSNHLFAVGGAHIDRRGQVSGAYVPGTSNPGVLSEEVGGVVFNALRNAVQHGVAASLLSVRGGDAAGDNVARCHRPGQASRTFPRSSSTARRRATPPCSTATAT